MLFWRDCHGPCAAVLQAQVSDCVKTFEFSAESVCYKTNSQPLPRQTGASTFAGTANDLPARRMNITLRHHRILERMFSIHDVVKTSITLAVLSGCP